VVLTSKEQNEGQILQAKLDYVRQLLYESSFYLQKEFTKPHNNQRKFSLAAKSSPLVRQHKKPESLAVASMASMASRASSSAGSMSAIFESAL